MHYATYDRYGSETSGGFDNTKVVLAFATAALRDAYIEKHGDDNMGIARISRTRALKIDKYAYVMDDIDDESPARAGCRQIEIRNGALAASAYVWETQRV
jgi:hypothetical protein